MTVRQETELSADPTARVDVWHFSVPCRASRNLLAHLDRSETDRFERIGDGEEAELFGTAHAALRVVLAAYIGCGPREISFARDANGRPRVVGRAAPDFSLSHSGTRAVVAVARQGRVGVDVERIRPRKTRDSVIERFFHRREHHLLAAVPGQYRDSAFTQLWTLKEAYLKAEGTGLRGGLDSFAIDWRPPYPRLLSPGGGRTGHTLATSVPGDGYRCGVVFRHETRKAEFRHICYPVDNLKEQILCLSSVVIEDYMKMCH